MCYNIGGNLIAVLTNILWHGSHRFMACHACCASFPVTGLVLMLQTVSALSHVVCIYGHFLPYTAPLYSRPLSPSL